MTERESPRAARESPRRARRGTPCSSRLIERFLPTGYRLVAEFLLSRLSQRADIVVVRLEGEPGPVEKIHSILDYLAAHTIIEYKGPTDDLAGEDVLVLLGYAFQYMRRTKLQDPGDVCLMVVADRITKSFLAQAKRSGMELGRGAAASGIWRGRFAGFVVHGVETGKVATSGPSEHFGSTRSRACSSRIRPAWGRWTRKKPRSTLGSTSRQSNTGAREVRILAVKGFRQVHAEHDGDVHEPVRRPPRARRQDPGPMPA